MKANSNNHPGKFTCTHGKWYYNANIVESVKTEEDGSKRTVYDYECIEVTAKPKPDSEINWDESTVDALIDAMDIAAKERPTLKCNIDISELAKPSADAQKKVDDINTQPNWSINCTKTSKDADSNEVTDLNEVE